MGVQLVNPFTLLAVEEKPEASPVLAAEKKEKDEKKKLKQKQRQRRRPASSAPKSNSNGGQNQHKGPADSVSISSSTSLNDVDQTKVSKSEEAEKNTEGDLYAEGWQLVQHQTRKKKGPRNGNHPQNQEKQGATVNNHVDVEEGIKQSQEVDRGMNGSQVAKPRKPNINGSARRRLQKKKDGAGQDQQVQATKDTSAASPAAAETAPTQKKFTVTYTLREFEKMKNNVHSNKSDEEHPHQPAEKSAKKDNSLKGRYAGKDNSFKGRYAEKDKSFKGRRNQNGGSRFNGDAEDVSPVTEEKAEEISFTLVPAEFPVLGKAL